MTDMDIKPDINDSTAQFSDSADNNYGYPLGNNATSGETTGENRMIVTDCSDQQDQNSGVDSVVKTEVETETEGEQVDAGSASSARSSQSDSSSGSKSAKSNDQMDYVVKLRGLPWSCTKDDVVDFLGSECKIYDDADGIHMVLTPDGKASGEAIVELASEEDQALALKKDKRHMGHRYIEVFKITRSEMEWVLKRNRPSNNSGPFSSGRSPGSLSNDTFVRLRGLPYECTKEDIHDFFHGLEIVSNGIQLMVDGLGRSSGEAYIQFASKDQAQKALGKDREMIKHRYVEIFTVSSSELRNMHSMVTRNGRSSSNRSGPYDRPSSKSDSRYGSGGGGGRLSSRNNSRGRGFDSDSWSNYDSWGGGGSGGGGGGGRSMNPPPLMPGLKRGRGDEGNTRHCVLMRGLPYKADEGDIRRFFSPLYPTAVHIIYESSGRPSGTAKVNFASNDDVTRAMAKHKDKMEHRYIELFVHKT